MDRHADSVNNVSTRQIYATTDVQIQSTDVGLLNRPKRCPVIGMFGPILNTKLD